MDASTLQAIINTLNRIPVTGKDNMGMMIACIRLLEDELKQGAQNGTNHPAE